jgi:hypothetical protein
MAKKRKLKIKIKNKRLKKALKNKKFVIASALSLISLTVLCLYFVYSHVEIPQTPKCTTDSRFCNTLSILKCDDGYVLNASNGASGKSIPDYYFCTPYKNKPRSLFYYTKNKSINTVFEEDSQLSIFKKLCPFENETEEYMLYVGDWRKISERCMNLNMNTYMYTEDLGYKFFCCFNRNATILRNDTNVNASQNYIFLYNETRIEK